jgi:hypothetical protein
VFTNSGCTSTFTGFTQDGPVGTYDEYSNGTLIANNVPCPSATPTPTPTRTPSLTPSITPTPSPSTCVQGCIEGTYSCSGNVVTCTYQGTDCQQQAGYIDQICGDGCCVSDGTAIGSYCIC